jgi:hypothetical protein
MGTDMLSSMRLCAAIPALALAFLGGAANAAPPSTAPLSENCDHKGWGFLIFSDHHFGTTNVCRKTISVWFMDKSGRLVHSDVAAGEVFDTGLTSAQFEEDTGWMAASCPQHYVPDPAPSLDSWDQILNSKYRCVRSK